MTTKKKKKKGKRLPSHKKDVFLKENVRLTFPGLEKKN